MPAKAVDHSADMLTVPTSSLASQLPQVLSRSQILWCLHNPVGAGLPAIAVLQPILIWLTHRYRQQAGSYNGFAVSVRAEWAS